MSLKDKRMSSLSDKLYGGKNTEEKKKRRKKKNKLKSGFRKVVESLKGNK